MEHYNKMEDLGVTNASRDVKIYVPLLKIKWQFHYSNFIPLKNS